MTIKSKIFTNLGRECVLVVQLLADPAEQVLDVLACRARLHQCPLAVRPEVLVPGARTHPGTTRISAMFRNGAEQHGELVVQIQD